jgi:hypothetical protein
VYSLVRFHSLDYRSSDELVGNAMRHNVHEVIDTLNGANRKIMQRNEVPKDGDVQIRIMTESGDTFVIKGIDVDSGQIIMWVEEGESCR